MSKIEIPLESGKFLRQDEDGDWALYFNSASAGYEPKIRWLNMYESDFVDSALKYGRQYGRRQTCEHKRSKWTADMRSGHCQDCDIQLPLENKNEDAEVAASLSGQTG